MSKVRQVTDAALTRAHKATGALSLVLVRKDGRVRKGDIYLPAQELIAAGQSILDAIKEAEEAHGKAKQDPQDQAEEHGTRSSFDEIARSNDRKGKPPASARGRGKAIGSAEIDKVRKRREPSF